MGVNGDWDWPALAGLIRALQRAGAGVVLYRAGGRRVRSAAVPPALKALPDGSGSRNASSASPASPHRSPVLSGSVVIEGVRVTFRYLPETGRHEVFAGEPQLAASGDGENGRETADRSKAGDEGRSGGGVLTDAADLPVVPNSPAAAPAPPCSPLALDGYGVLAPALFCSQRTAQNAATPGHAAFLRDWEAWLRTVAACDLAVPWVRAVLGGEGGGGRGPEAAAAAAAGAVAGQQHYLRQLSATLRDALPPATFVRAPAWETLTADLADGASPLRNALSAAFAQMTGPVLVGMNTRACVDAQWAVDRMWETEDDGGGGASGGVAAGLCSSVTQAVELVRASAAAAADHEALSETGLAPVISLRAAVFESAGCKTPLAEVGAAAAFRVFLGLGGATIIAVAEQVLALAATALGADVARLLSLVPRPSSFFFDHIFPEIKFLFERSVRPGLLEICAKEKLVLPIGASFTVLVAAPTAAPTNLQMRLTNVTLRLEDAEIIESPPAFSRNELTDAAFGDRVRSSRTSDVYCTKRGREVVLRYFQDNNYFVERLQDFPEDVKSLGCLKELAHVLRSGGDGTGIAENT